jgi:hypothetical protein
MEVCCECCVLSGRGLCDELMIRPEESYRLWCVVMCDLKASWMRRPWPTGGCLPRPKKKNCRRAVPRNVVLCECSIHSCLITVVILMTVVVVKILWSVCRWGYLIIASNNAAADLSVSCQNDTQPVSKDKDTVLDCITTLSWNGTELWLFPWHTVRRFLESVKREAVM